MKRSMTYKSILGACGLVLLFSYQNCSKVGTGLAIQDKAAGVNQSGTDESGNPIITVGHDGSSDTTPAPVGDGSGGGIVKDNPGQIPTETCIKPAKDKEAIKAQMALLQQMANDGDAQTNITICKDDDSHTQPGSPTIPLPGTPTTGPVANPTPSAPTVPAAPSIDQVNLAIKYCDEAKGIRASHSTKISGLTGDYVGVTDHVDGIHGITGSLTLLAETATSTIGRIDGITAANKDNRAVVLCGFEVDDLGGVTGNVFLVDTVVKKAHGITGTIVLVNSVMDDIRGLTGKVKVLSYSRP